LTTLQAREEEKKREATTNHENATIGPMAQAERQTNPLSPNHDTMSFVDFDANDWFNRWLTDPKSDFESQF
jgi:hypothetical protein